jgi:membrane-bound metal-dependent hydrolase YbcI (DUF457 family)
MAQAGIHALVAAVIRKYTPKREWMMLGIILGSLFPDLDNYGVAVATVARIQTVGYGLHRTFTHSIFTIIAAVIIFFLAAKIFQQPRWLTLGIGFGIGIAMHIALDLLIWFNGVELLWPLGGWVNLWSGVLPPPWLARLLDPAEFLFFGLYFAWLASAARKLRTDPDFLDTLRGWTVGMAALLIVFTPLSFLLTKGFVTIFGVFYLISLTAAFLITIRMRKTIGAST